MNQVFGSNYQSYQPSYNYQTPSSGQWPGQTYSQGSAPTGAYYNTSKMTGSPYESHNRNTYSTHCMGNCNPPKLYADTYSYLTENLMKPVIEEVYQDLKSITAANTVANNSEASKMGLLTQSKIDHGQGIQQNQGQNQFPSNSVPFGNSYTQGQQQIPADKPVSPAQNRFMPQNKQLHSQMGNPGHVQQNAVVGRNGLVPV